MKKIFQTKHTNLAKGEYGNCIQTCIACVTEIPIEKIPLFYRFCDYKKFFEENGMTYLSRRGKPPSKDNVLYIASYEVAGVKEIGHVVLYRNGRIIHDPKYPRVRLYRIYGYHQILTSKPSTSFSTELKNVKIS